jgi:hypothetical protein
MTLSFGRAMAQAVSSRPLTAEALVWPQASPYGGTPACFSEYFIFPPVSILTPMPHANIHSPSPMLISATDSLVE